jgi:hypothetical protein
MRRRLQRIQDSETDLAVELDQVYIRKAVAGCVGEILLQDVKQPSPNPSALAGGGYPHSPQNGEFKLSRKPDHANDGVLFDSNVERVGRIHLERIAVLAEKLKNSAEFLVPCLAND